MIYFILSYILVGIVWASGASLYYGRKRVARWLEFSLHTLLWPLPFLFYVVSSFPIWKMRINMWREKKKK